MGPADLYRHYAPLERKADTRSSIMANRPTTLSNQRKLWEGHLAPICLRASGLGDPTPTKSSSRPLVFRSSRFLAFPFSRLAPLPPCALALKNLPVFWSSRFPVFPFSPLPRFRQLSCTHGAVGNSTYQMGKRKKPETPAQPASYYPQHNRPNSSHILVFWAQNPETGDPCEFFHKKRLDRYLDLLYYRASLLL